MERLYMDCRTASALIAGYVDGELSEAQASPLRQHLLSCAGCRSLAQDSKTLKGWFVPDAAVPVPPGFASRVARRAFAGDRGREWAREGEAFTGERNVRTLVLGLTALAASLLIAVSLLLGTMQRPQTGDLWADDLSREAVIERLDELNRVEDAEPAPKAKTPTEEEQRSKREQR
jgi:anti-sigma factor RsiW